MMMMIRMEDEQEERSGGEFSRVVRAKKKRGTTSPSSHKIWWRSPLVSVIIIWFLDGWEKDGKKKENERREKERCWKEEQNEQNVPQNNNKMYLFFSGVNHDDETLDVFREKRKRGRSRILFSKKHWCPIEESEHSHHISQQNYNKNPNNDSIPTFRRRNRNRFSLDFFCGKRGIRQFQVTKSWW